MDKTDLKRTLLTKLEDRSCVVGVIGLGYVGLPFAVEKAKMGFRVIGVEQNPRRASQVNLGESFIGDVPSQELSALVRNQKLQAVTDFARVAEMDVIVIAVPTPLTKNLTPDLQYVENVTTELAKHLRRGQLVSLESTTYPGTTEEVMLPILESSGLKVEQDFFLAHSPERVDPGNKRYSTKNTTKVVGGVGPESLEVATQFYRQTIQNVVKVSNSQAAELVKVFENTFRSVNIALVNELTLLCDRMGLNAWEVLDAAFTKPFGIMPFYPGPGVGGHCIPIDPHYLEWKAKEFNFNTRFIALAGEINRRMPEFVVDKTRKTLNKLGCALSAAKILVLGTTYKKDLDDSRESPAIEVMHLLLEEGAKLVYHDPFVPTLKLGAQTYSSEPLNEDLIRSCDLVLILTDHSKVNYGLVTQHAGHVFDTRNATRALVRENAKLRERITLL